MAPSAIYETDVEKDENSRCVSSVSVCERRPQDGPKGKGIYPRSNPSHPPFTEPNSMV